MAEGCPVKKQQPSAAAVSEGRGKDRTYYEYWTSWMSSSPPPSSPLSPSASNSASCPSQLHTPSSTSGMSGKVGSGYNPLTNDMMFGQEKQPSQTVDLSTRRAVSSIPRGDFTPAHQLASVDQWVYPSEQQYFNAMKVVRSSHLRLPMTLYCLLNAN